MNERTHAGHKFLERYFEELSVDEIKNRYGGDSNDRFDLKTFSSVHDSMAEVFLSGIDERGIPDNVGRSIVERACTFASKKHKPDSWKHDGHVFVELFRLKRLLMHPVFLADPTSASVVIALRDVACVSWGRKLWSYRFGNDAPREWADAFGIRQIDGLHRLILTEELWNGTLRGFYDVFFVEVGETLRSMGVRTQHAIETIQSRIDLLMRWKSHMHMDYQSWSNVAFWDYEVESMLRRGEIDPTVRRLAKIVIQHRLNYTPELV